MNDEASTHYVDIVDQMTLGHAFIRDNFGATPRIGIRCPLPVRARVCEYAYCTCRVAHRPVRPLLRAGHALRADGL